jgi:lysophospholipase L1-like esterase
MNILFIGDSLINGTVGVNWVKTLEQRHPEWLVDNEGVNGDTITRITDRLERKLQLKSDYDFVVLGAGTNDILIPSFARRGFLYRLAYRHLLREGYAPIGRAKEFEYALHQAISVIQERTRARVILLTLSCLNENPGYPLNTLRAEFNEVIRDLAWDRHCRVADTGLVFDNHLQKYPGQDYLLKNFFNTAWFDKWQCGSEVAADRLSRERGLRLTIDGVHLNSRGAKIYGCEIEKQILRII